MNRRSGRAHILTILAVIAAVVVAAIIFTSRGDSETTIATRFMSGLAEGDPKKLAQYSVMGDLPQEEREKRWTKTMEYARGYRFAWRIERSHQLSPNEAIVRMQIRRNAATQTYDEPYELTLERVGGEWKVDAYSISREMFPALPR